MTDQMPAKRSLRNLFIAPISNRPRDRRMLALLASDQPVIWSSDIFRAEYGEFPMQGIDIAPETFTDGPVLVQSVFADRSAGMFKKIALSATAAGYVQSEGDEPNIQLNTVLYSPLGQVLGLFNGRGSALRLKTIMEMGFLGASVSYAEMLTSAAQVLSSARYQTIAGISQIMLSSVADTIGHEHIHIRQLKHETRTLADQQKKPLSTFIRSERRKQSDHTGGVMKFAFDLVEKFGGYWMAGYYLADYEVQARLHTVMTHGYQRWGRLPGNRTELFDALADCGLPVPKGMHGELTPKGRPTPFRTTGGLRRTFNAYTDPATADLAATQNHLYFPALKIFFWEGMLAYQYGLLMEYYGDANGRAKMGFSSGPIKISRRRRKLAREEAEEMGDDDEKAAKSATAVPRIGPPPAP